MPGIGSQWRISFQQEETEVFESEEMKSPWVLRSLCFLLFNSFGFSGLTGKTATRGILHKAPVLCGLRERMLESLHRYCNPFAFCASRVPANHSRPS